METKTKNNEKPIAASLPVVSEKNISDGVLARVAELEKTGGLQIPRNYSAANAIKSAWLILQNTVDRDKHPVLTACTKESIANALLDMVIQGLAPGKNVKMVLEHKDGSKEEVSLKHSYNSEQIKWFQAGSALNLIAAKVH